MAVRPSFQHATPAFRTFSGDQALAALPRELDRLGCSRALVVGGPWLAGFPQVKAALKGAMGARLAGWFDDVEEHSPLPSVLAAREQLGRSRWHHTWRRCRLPRPQIWVDH